MVSRWEPPNAGKSTSYDVGPPFILVISQTFQAYRFFIGFNGVRISRVVLVYGYFYEFVFSRMQLNKRNADLSFCLSSILSNYFVSHSLDYRFIKIVSI